MGLRSTGDRPSLVLSPHMPPNATNSTGNTTGNATAPAGGGSGGFIDPVDFVLGGLEGIANSLASGAAALLNAFNHVLFGIDAPGVAGDISSWGPPESGLWVGAWALFWTLTPLCLAFLVLQAMRAQGSTSGRDSRAKLAEIAKCAGMILLGWPIAVGGLHLADAVAMGLVPEGSQLLHTPGNVAKVGLGVVVGVVLIVFQSSMALTAVLVVLLERVVLIFAVAAWPVWWATRPSDGGFSNAVSGIGLSMYVGVAGAKVVQSALAYLVFQSEWSIAGVDAVFVDVLGSAVGLGAAFVGIPVVVGRNFVPEVMTILGTPAVDVAEDYAERGREQAGDVAKDYAGSAREYAATRTPDSLPASTWSHSGAEGATATVPEGYTPEPEPGANATTPSSGQTRAQRERQYRLNERLGDSGRD
jgi:hypothetical protein